MGSVSAGSQRSSRPSALTKSGRSNVDTGRLPMVCDRPVPVILALSIRASLRKSVVDQVALVIKEILEHLGQELDDISGILPGIDSERERPEIDG